MSLKPINDKLTECDELKSKVKRCFEIEKEATGWEEYLALRDEIMKLVGIKE